MSKKQNWIRREVRKLGRRTGGRNTEGRRNGEARSG